MTVPPHLSPPTDGRDYLFSLTHHGVKLGLENITGILAACGNPHERFPAVHVAGTNGKGSVLAFLDAMLRASGYRTGRFTSPHLIDVRERFLIDAVPLTESRFEALAAGLREAAATLPHPPTFFELTTALAFEAFAAAKVDVGLIETGLGGRLDSTNVLSPVATGITPIGFDHMAYLGDTIEAIAGEKAGILKPGVPAVIASQSNAALRVLLERAAAANAPVQVSGQDFCHSLDGGLFHFEGTVFRVDGVRLGLQGRFQSENAAVAVALAETLRERFPRISEATVRTGLVAARWPGRLEQVMDDPPVVLDVAHNPDGARELAAHFGACVVVLAVSNDKDARGMAEALAPNAVPLIVTQYDGPRSMAAADLAAHCRAVSREAPLMAKSLPEAIRLGLGHATATRPLLVTGSIFTVGEARAYLMAEHGAPPLAF